ncbi:SUR7/PalI family-domain-containing protein [Lineolata rhizophorae]|uniref:SUR7/PalI family-domain-containing protein n=1 Tax=Lineolata rhizophorae TaxID=578093 RepID=A0A6A6PBG5_9PEZI|nr:SUR7/PalI family-domain-containing protein [Lineolata rhizophorae]
MARLPSIEPVKKLRQWAPNPRRQPKSEPAAPSSADGSSPDSSPTLEAGHRPHLWIRGTVRTRKRLALLTSFLHFVSLVFLILAEIGNTYDMPVLRNTYFIKLDLSDIIPRSVPNAVLINSIARTLGLHDFYQVGLWNYCEGYNTDGITHCSDTTVLYWFNPVQILQSQLIAGATIALPNEINDILDIIKIASNWMFALFILGAVLSTVLIFLVPAAVYSRWTAVPLVTLTTLNALAIGAASIIGTAMFVIFHSVVSSVAEVNIHSDLSGRMYAFIWIATACAALSWLVHVSFACCCVSRRDVARGVPEKAKAEKKRGSSEAGDSHDAEKRSSGRKRLAFGRKKGGE